MADRALSTSRRTLLGAAASLPLLALPAAARGQACTPVPAPDAEQWTPHLTRYRALAARTKTAAETGWFRAANDTYNRACADRTADRQAAFARVDRAENLFWHRCTAPLAAAAEALVLTPTPDLEALRVKLAVIRVHQLHEEGSMRRDCIEVLEEDVHRSRLVS
jgi:hypothetical protein